MRSNMAIVGSEAIRSGEEAGIVDMGEFSAFFFKFGRSNRSRDGKDCSSLTHLQ